MGAACNLSPIELTRRRVDLRAILRQAVGLDETPRGVVVRFPATEVEQREPCVMPCWSNASAVRNSAT